jgi:dTDP-4-amino-4,6-dideoxygalactose transaminase
VPQHIIARRVPEISATTAVPCLDKSYIEIVRHYDACLRRHGDTAQGADWPNEIDRQTRFSVMLDIFATDASNRIDLLDFACGTGELLRFIQEQSGQKGEERGRPAISYLGVDTSALALQHARAKFSTAKFLKLDVLQATDDELATLCSDYCVISGLFTLKRGLSHDQMWDFMTRVIGRLWPRTRKAMAFNVMSKQVDRERDDLFHVSLDQMASFLQELAGRSITFRADYGLFEYTCYVWKKPRTSVIARPAMGVAKSVKSDASKVCRPLLPALMRIAPYIEEIDRRRWYTNFGEATFRLAARLAAHFGLENAQCVTAGSGTAALTAALIAVAGRVRADRPYCLMPSYTFVGTPAAALNAGYEPYFVDIDPQSLSIEPERLLGHPILRQTGVVIVVGRYGRPVAQSGWERFSLVSGVPVVIDAAAGFDAVSVNPAETLGSLPVMLSLHATKVFGVGEGGLILCRDAELVRRCRRALNFGFLDCREATVSGFNGKMSEYHAAVGLASLDSWPSTRAGFLAAAETYRQAANLAGLGEKIIAETAWASSYVLYRAATAADAATAEKLLSEAGIDFRLWYGRGCHRQPAYAEFSRDPLPATEEVSPRVIGLPVAVDLAEEAIKDTIAVLAGG